MHAYICTYIHTYIATPYKHAQIVICIHAHAYIYICTYSPTYIHMHIIHRHTCTHTYIGTTYIHRHIYTHLYYEKYKNQILVNNTNFSYFVTSV